MFADIVNTLVSHMLSIISAGETMYAIYTAKNTLVLVKLAYQNIKNGSPGCVNGLADVVNTLGYYKKRSERHERTEFWRCNKCLAIRFSLANLLELSQCSNYCCKPILEACGRGQHHFGQIVNMNFSG